MSKAKSAENILSAKESDELISILKSRFEKNMKRHKDVEWSKVKAKLEADPEKLRTLNEMEKTGGEPDVVTLAAANKKSGEIIFCDCAEESPKGRRSICYDRAALDSRKEHKPKDNALDMAASIGIEILSEEEYRQLQELENFDTKTSSWIMTPEHIRKLGGALFCDRRYNNVFLYHNGADSYYAARGFRGKLEV